MARLIASLLLLVVTAVLAGRPEIYEGHQLFRIGSSSQIIAYLDTKIDVLSATPAARSASGHIEAIVRLSPEERQQWLNYFHKNGVSFTKIVDNLADIIRNEEAMLSRSRKVSSRDGSIDNNNSDENGSNEEENGNIEDNESDENRTTEKSESAEENGSDQSKPSKERDSTEENKTSEESESSSSESSSSESSSSESSSSESSSSESSSSESSSSEENDDLIWQDIRWDTYYRHKEINAFLDDLAAKYPDLVTVINPTLSSEGRQIKYVRISTSRFENLRKPVIVIDAAMHAREWITTPVAMYIINQLVVDIVDSNLVELLDWIIVPMANPDGYEYSIDEDRMWRKTRSRNHVGGWWCPGVDGNRNFDHHWGTLEGASIPCSLIYEGPAPFSEPEVRVIRDIIEAHDGRTAMYISLHSYGNMFLYAWGNNGTLPPNAVSLHLAGIRMVTAIEKLALEKADRYIVGNAANVLYITTGTSRDWTRAAGVPLTYTLELPGYEFGFLVPPKYISQVVKETWAGIAEGARYVISLYY